ncbi:hypothetical protein [Streptomyces palmae]|uniref:hypothetical protein n=1 Tax=Streptomyces palmae TaxID=1701085 RepID=UPI001AE032D9|nr:hypothetical protein [Streptomyces palmae]
MNIDEYAALDATARAAVIASEEAQSARGLPIGVQLAGPVCSEAVLLRVAGQLEDAMPWADRRPAVHAATLR